MKKIISLFAFCLLCINLFAADINKSQKMLSEWNSLSEYEKWFCLLSEPLTEQNSLNVTTVNPKDEKTSKDLLENS